jgi:murein DD-endopeptidase MepM/ murein hydrolase activator NlpD
MVKSVRTYQPFSLIDRSVFAMGAACALFVAGCSASVSRFDGLSTASLNESSSPATSPSRERSNLFGNQDTAGSTGSSQGQSSQGQYSQGSQGQYSSGDAYAPPRSPYRDSGMSRAELPPPQQPADTNAYRPASRPAATVPPIQPREPSPSYDAPQASAGGGGGGEQIEVQPGDTLYSLSRRHNVAISEIMSANDLKSQSLKPGQKLNLPSGASARVSQPLPRTKSYETASTPATDAPADWTGSYTLKPGDSLYAVARQHNVKVADLERYNGISDVRKVKPGATLKLPASAGSAPAASEPPPSTAYQPPPPSTGDRNTAPSAQPTILNAKDPNASGDGRVAKLDTPATADDTGAATPGSGSVAGSSKLRWPVAGKVISGFGPRADGTHNDGVNVAAPMGTDVHAAESGVVAYAGDELKGYGNLVLLRHDNGWVTAYAHADEIMVKRGDRIKRGQVIAKAGRTGQVDQPQVHFELRQGQKPVDPTPFMERM